MGSACENEVVIRNNIGTVYVSDWLTMKITSTVYPVIHNLAANLVSRQVPTGVSLKDDGPTGQTRGQRGSDQSAYRVTNHYNRVL